MLMKCRVCSRSFDWNEFYRRRKLYCSERCRNQAAYERNRNKRPKLREAYRMQRVNAARRGIAFELTFDEWLGVWQASGHLAERGGRKRGQYVMARPKDQGAYTLGNVQIVRMEDNRAEQTVPPLSPESRSKLSRALRGDPRLRKPKSIETRRKIGEGVARAAAAKRGKS